MMTPAPLIYELWDTDTANLVDDYEDEAEALRIIREGVQADGPDRWLSVALTSVAPDGQRHHIAREATLIARARFAPQRSTCGIGDSSSGKHRS